MEHVKAMTIKQLISKLQTFENDNRIVMVLRYGSGDLYPITSKNWKVYEAGEVFFPNTSVLNENEPALCISVI